MRRSLVVYRFGAFELDLGSGRLLRAGQPVPLRHIPFATLVHLLVHAPGVVSKESIAAAVWGGMASSESIESAISQVRRALAEGDDTVHIVTVRNEGYRFVGGVEEIAPLAHHRAETTGGDALEAFVSGQRQLATLRRTGIVQARRLFDHAIQRDPACTPAYAEMAMAESLSFEATRFAATCDVDAPARAAERARMALALDRDSPDATSALGFALSLNGEHTPAAVAAWRAVIRDRTWRHSLRLAFVCWGDARVRASHDTLALRPQAAFAYFLEAMVLVARGALDPALSRLVIGCAAQDRQHPGSASFPAVGLHLLRGLVLAAQGRLDDALAAFEAELHTPIRDHVYSQQSIASTWYAQGAVRLRMRDVRGAEAAFQQALDIAPMHFFSMAALGRPIPELPPTDPRATDAAIARTIALARANRQADAMRLYADILAAARAPNKGWLLPVEPILQPGVRGDLWASVLATVSDRAT
jgi:DNA-binding winged helix-turn-helix (wHTH) protein